MGIYRLNEKELILSNSYMQELQNNNIEQLGSLLFIERAIVYLSDIQTKKAKWPISALCFLLILFLVKIAGGTYRNMFPLIQ